MGEKIGLIFVTLGEVIVINFYMYNMPSTGTRGKGMQMDNCGSNRCGGYCLCRSLCHNQAYLSVS